MASRMPPVDSADSAGGLLCEDGYPLQGRRWASRVRRFGFGEEREHAEGSASDGGGGRRGVHLAGVAAHDQGDGLGTFWGRITFGGPRKSDGYTGYIGYIGYTGACACSSGP